MLLSIAHAGKIYTEFQRSFKLKFSSNSLATLSDIMRLLKFTLDCQNISYRYVICELIMHELFKEPFTEIYYYH